MKTLSKKSLTFCERILNHYPLTDNKSSESQPEQIQPYGHLHDHRKEREIYDKSTAEKLENMQYFKNIGNQHYKNQRLDDALYFYQKVIVYSDYTFPKEPLQLCQMDLLIQQANINTAICRIKKQQWAKAEVNLRQTIKFGQKQIDTNKFTDGEEVKKAKKIKESSLNSLKKGYYWFCKYYINAGKYNQARAYTEKLQSLNCKINTKQELEQLQQQIQTIKENYEEQEKKISKKMFTSTEV